MQTQSAIAWAEKYLRQAGYLQSGHFNRVRAMPWSSVYGVGTSLGQVFLKCMAAPFAIEAKCIKFLNLEFKKRVPQIIAYEESLNCFLMLDAGQPLRHILKQGYQETLACSALSSYANLQKENIVQVKRLLELGLADWRLEYFPQLYLEFLKQEEFLIAEGLQHSELKKLQGLYSQVQEICECLSHYKIPDTIEHGDFQDNNILIDEHNNLIVSDWGDVVITHPFFSILTFLRSAMQHHFIDEKCSFYEHLEDAYLDQWKEFEDKARLREVLGLVKQLYPIKFCLSFYRVSCCPAMKGLGDYQGLIATALKEWMAQQALADAPITVLSGQQYLRG